jgi:hypothetical protein
LAISIPAVKSELPRARPSAALGRLDLYAGIQGILHSWSGFPALSELMRVLPTLDVYVAGGVLRDTLSQTGRAPKDFDFFVDGPSLDSILGPLRSHGTITFGPFGSPRWFPFASKDTYADIIHVRNFYNGLTRCDNMTDVLRQFDFTANAIAVNLRTGQTMDPLNGIEDITRRIMRGVRFDYPDEPISSGHPISRPSVLWFRLLHYAALGEMNIEPVTLSWLYRNRIFKRDLGYFSKIFFPPDPRSMFVYSNDQ